MFITFHTELKAAQEYFSELATEITERSKDSGNRKFRDLGKILKVVKVVYQRLSEATPDNTNQGTIFEIRRIAGEMSNHWTALLNLTEDKGITDLLIKLDEYADSLLKLYPFINVTNNAEINIQKVSDYLLFAEQSKEELENRLSRAADILKEALGKKTEIGNVSEILATKVLVGDYHERAQKEKEEAKEWTQRTWQIIIGGGILLVFIIVLQFFIPLDDRQYYQYLSSKFLIALTIGLLAKWTSKRASRHLAEESKYHRLAVNMATVREFISTLPDDQKSLVLSTVAIKTFTDSTGNELPTEYESLNFLDLVKGLLPKTEK